MSHGSVTLKPDEICFENRHDLLYQFYERFTDSYKCNWMELEIFWYYILSFETCAIILSDAYVFKLRWACLVFFFEIRMNVFISLVPLKAFDDKEIGFVLTTNINLTTENSTHNNTEESCKAYYHSSWNDFKKYFNSMSSTNMIGKNF